MGRRPRHWLATVTAAATLFVVSACITDGAGMNDKEAYSSLSDPCQLLDEATLRRVVGADLEEERPGAAPAPPTTQRTQKRACSWRFERESPEPGPYRRRIEVNATLYSSYREESGVHWAEIGYRQQRDLFEENDPAPVEGLGDEATTWHETSLFVGAHVLFRDSNLVVGINYGGSDLPASGDSRGMSPDEAKQGALQLARAAEENL